MPITACNYGVHEFTPPVDGFKTCTRCGAVYIDTTSAVVPQLPPAPTFKPCGMPSWRYGGGEMHEVSHGVHPWVDAETGELHYCDGKLTT